MSRRFPVRPEEFETAFVEQVFDAAPGSLISLSHEPVGTGQVCDSYRFACDWTKGSHPATFIAKCPSADPVSRGAAAIFHLYDMEVGWYRDVADHCDALCPKSYHADIAENEQEFVLLLEDMAPAAQGDQLAGALLIQVETSLAEAAALHSFKPPAGFENLPWLGHGEGNAQFLEKSLAAGYPLFRERFSSLLSPDILDLGQQLVDGIGTYIAHPPEQQAITHGDMRLDNILFHDDGRIAALVDWQTCSLGNPANDVAYLTGGGMRKIWSGPIWPCGPTRPISTNSGPNIAVTPFPASSWRSTPRSTSNGPSAETGCLRRWPSARPRWPSIWTA